MLGPEFQGSHFPKLGKNESNPIDLYKEHRFRLTDSHTYTTDLYNIDG